MKTVVRLEHVNTIHVRDLLIRFAIELRLTACLQIPGSYWGEEEAGLIGNILYARTDTPVHSVLHESCHYICMPPSMRESLHTTAGGDYNEENAVCYLQVLLADHLQWDSRQQMLEDMDAWGYTFRLGSSQAWFDGDADDARQWLLDAGLVSAANKPTWCVRQT